MNEYLRIDHGNKSAYIQINLHDNQDISGAWKNIRKARKISVEESLVLYEQKQLNHGFMKNVKHF